MYCVKKIKCKLTRLAKSQPSESAEGARRALEVRKKSSDEVMRRVT